MKSPLLPQQVFIPLPVFSPLRFLQPSQSMLQANREQSRRIIKSANSANNGAIVSLASRELLDRYENNLLCYFFHEFVNGK
jgi:hypothetical protein